MRMKKYSENSGEAASNVSAAENAGLTIEESLKQDGFVMSTVTGVSMLPTLRQNLDRVIIEPPRGRLGKYDIALYRRWDGQYVLHRVLDVRETCYVIRGDNTYIEEYVPFAVVVGVATHFVRGGRMVDVTDGKYLRYVRFLYKVYPVRRLVWRCRVLGSQVKMRLRNLGK